ncbi:Cas10/Cmr2 second palm domain-containing protein [Actinoalloteichus caeruleus]|uniref:GGDEF domain-containing protein n=1 Tax=Actinoalloteichus caeruleus DSM 43889 TaxID=1120930 RepID=A0ABT1JGX6_ACTCY|nr:hypothetical protein [Actinoalloteichus caeruleus]MCP2331668.1 hypothetical protein [Actinoalloteichus caeruleus DSM 43889]
MRTYLDIAAVRIQRYLARTPTLRGRRTASAALVDMRSVAAEALAGTGAWLNAEAGEIDGVVSLELDSPDDVDRVSAVVLRALRRRLPGAEFQVVWATDLDYVTAYAEQMRPTILSGRSRVDLPTVAELPLAALCRLCGIDPAVTTATLDDAERNVCADCVERESWRSLSASRTGERRLASRLNREPVNGGFEALAGMGRRETRIAVIHADGNRIGAFFRQLANIPAERLRAPENAHLTRDKLALELSKATFEALAEATMSVRGIPGRSLPLILHVLGGDDVLVSVPADHAWQFARALLAGFNERMSRLVRGLDLEVEISAPTMSAAMVFARHDESFTTIVALAESALARGKRAGAGRSSWLCFHDLTTEGRHDEGSVVPLHELKQRQDELTELARAPRSFRENLALALADGGPEAALAHSRRVGVTAGTPFLPRRGSDPAREAEHTPAGMDGDSPTRLGLDTALRIARWW